MYLCFTAFCGTWLSSVRRVIIRCVIALIFGSAALMMPAICLLALVRSVFSYLSVRLSNSCTVAKRRIISAQFFDVFPPSQKPSWYGHP